MSNIGRAVRQTPDVDIARLIREGNAAKFATGAVQPNSRTANALEELLAQGQQAMADRPPDAPVNAASAEVITVNPDGTITSPGGIKYRGGSTESLQGGNKVVGRTDELGNPARDKKTPAELNQDRLTMKKNAREGVPVTVGNDGTVRKRNNKVSAESTQYPDLIPDNPSGATIESILSGDPGLIEHYRSWYANASDADKALIADRLGGDAISQEALSVIQGSDLSPERLAAIRAVNDEGVGSLDEAAPAGGSYVAPDDLKKPSSAGAPEGVKQRLPNHEIMRVQKDADGNVTNPLPEPAENGKIYGAQGVGSLGKQLSRGKVKDGEYVSAPRVNDRQAELDNTSELRSFTDQLRMQLDRMGGGRQGAKKNAPRTTDEQGFEYSSGAGAQRKGSRMPDPGVTSGDVQDLWQRMQTGQNWEKSLSPTKAFKTPEEFAEHALSLAESNPSNILSDADAFSALADAARREWYTPGNTRAVTDEPSVGNQLNPEQPYISKPEGRWQSEGSAEGGLRTKAEDTDYNVNTEGETPEVNSGINAEERAALNQWEAEETAKMHDALAGRVAEVPETRTFMPGDYPEAALRLKVAGWNFNEMDGKWHPPGKVRTVAAPHSGQQTVRYAKDPTDPNDPGVVGTFESNDIPSIGTTSLFAEKAGAAKKTAQNRYAVPAEKKGGKKAAAPPPPPPVPAPRKPHPASQNPLGLGYDPAAARQMKLLGDLGTTKSIPRQAPPPPPPPPAPAPRRKPHPASENPLGPGYDPAEARINKILGDLGVQQSIPRPKPDPVPVIAPPPEPPPLPQHVLNQQNWQKFVDANGGSDSIAIAALAKQRGQSVQQVQASLDSYLAPPQTTPADLLPGFPSSSKAPPWSLLKRTAVYGGGTAATLGTAGMAGVALNAMRENSASREIEGNQIQRHGKPISQMTPEEKAAARAKYLTQ